MHKKIGLSILMLSYLLCVNAQQFIAEGKIEFEKIVNVHKQFDSDNEFSEALKSNTSKYKYSYFDLHFKGPQTLYNPGKKAEQASNNFIMDVANENIVFSDLEKGTSTSQKQVFETRYLISDSILKINWKLTTDTRKIAGFNCRKATAIIMDSVYVFAFYTDEILTSGGPEGFTGLPGMILGIAIPRLNATWFATKLELTPPSPSTFIAPAKGKKTNRTELIHSLKDNLKDWGDWADKNIWWIML